MSSARYDIEAIKERIARQRQALLTEYKNPLGTTLSSQINYSDHKNNSQSFITTIVTKNETVTRKYLNESQGSQLSHPTTHNSNTNTSKQYLNNESVIDKDSLHLNVSKILPRFPGDEDEDHSVDDDEQMSSNDDISPIPKEERAYNNPTRTLVESEKQLFSVSDAHTNVHSSIDKVPTREDQNETHSSSNRIRQKYNLSRSSSDMIQESKLTSVRPSQHAHGDDDEQEVNQEGNSYEDPDVNTDEMLEENPIMLDQVPADPEYNFSMTDKIKLKQERLNEAISQAKKIERAIELSEQKEEELKKERLREVESQKIKLHQMNLEVEQLKDRLEVLRTESDELHSHMNSEEKQYFDQLGGIERRKGSTHRELDAITSNFNKEVEQKEVNHHLFEMEMDELKKKVEILGNKEKEKRKEIEAKERVIELLKQEESATMALLEEYDSEDLPSELQSYMNKLKSFQKEKTDLVLELEKYRRLYPLEVSLVEKQEEYDSVTSNLTNLKHHFIDRRKQIQISIDEMQKQLWREEEENERFRKEFNDYRKREEEAIYSEKRKIDAARRVIDINAEELRQQEEVVERAKHSYEEYAEQMTLQIRLLDLEIKGVDDKIIELTRTKIEKSGSLFKRFVESIEEYESTKKGVETNTCLSELEMRTDASDDLIEMCEELQPIMIESPVMKVIDSLDNSLITILQMHYPDIQEKEGILQEVLSNGDESQRTVRTLSDEIHHLQNRILITFKETLFNYTIDAVENSDTFDVHEKSLHLMDNASLFPEMKQKIQIEMNELNEKKKYIVDIIMQFDNHNLEKSIQLQVFSQWRSILISQHETKFSVLTNAEEVMNHYLESMNSKTQSLRREIEAASDVIQVSDWIERSEKLKTRINQERQRMSTFAQHISGLEEQVTSLSSEKKQAEQKWDELVEQEKEFEVSSHFERNSIQEDLAIQYKAQSQSEMIAAGDRLTTFTKIVRKVQEISSYLEEAKERSETDGTSELIIYSIDTQTRVQQETSRIQADLLDIQLEFSNLVNEMTIISKEKRRLEEQVQNLILEERQSDDIQHHEIFVKQTKKEQLSDLFYELSQQEIQTRQEFDQLSMTHKKRIEEKRKEIIRTNALYNQHKKNIGPMKSQIDAIEARFSSEISKIRGQRQLLRHRLDLKIKAIDNLNQTVDLGVPSKQASSKQKVRNVQKPPETESNTYFKMYIKKKDPEQEEKQSLSDLNLMFSPVPKVHTKTPPHPQVVPALSNPEKEDVEPAVLKQSPLPSTNILRHINRDAIGNAGFEGTNVAYIRLFGPQTKPLTEEEVQHLISLTYFMCNGTLLHKKREKAVSQQSVKGSYDIRHMSLSPELTRLQIRDKKKKVPESFIKIEHVLKVQVDSRPMSDSLAFSLILKDKKISFLTYDENDFQKWVQGIRILVENKLHLFSLKYNIKDVLNGHSL